MVAALRPDPLGQQLMCSPDPVAAMGVGRTTSKETEGRGRGLLLRGWN